MEDLSILEIPIVVKYIYIYIYIYIRNESLRLPCKAFGNRLVPFLARQLFDLEIGTSLKKV